MEGSFGVGSGRRGVFGGTGRLPSVVRRIRDDGNYVRRTCRIRIAVGPTGARSVPGSQDLRGGGSVSDHVYRLSEIVGSSPNSVDEAIRTAIAKAAQTVRNIEWFQTEEIRGQVVDGGVAYFQVRLKIGFRVD